MSDAHFSMEAEIAAEVTKMKAAFTPRALMVQRVAEIMFDAWGEKPSANKVYEHIRQGSISDINNDLKQFWDGLRRRKAGGREVEGIPSNLSAESGELIKSMWVTALLHATKTFDAEKLSLKQVAEDLTAQVEQLQQALQERELTVDRQKRENSDLLQQVKEQATAIVEYEDSLNTINEDVRLLKADKVALQQQATVQENSHNEAIRKLVDTHAMELESLRRDLKHFQLEKDRAATRRDQIQAEAIESRKLLDQTISALHETIASERNAHIRIKNAWDAQQKSLDDQIQRLSRDLNKARQVFNNYNQLTAQPNYLAYKIKYD
ncbi:DNA-binding protein [Diaphorobacter caeni]|uniref:DNA-binding protein n=1 Tax=Diaphorobacter caeni TaxID=2784387 RepID=UPI00188E0D1D|nr:DNA-binding protein [Diaphorobacter caeni]MBF5007934.1 DNA-binding protein [Diaphorobacter caeni]